MNDYEYHTKSQKALEKMKEPNLKEDHYFESEEFEDFEPMDLANFYGFLYGFKLSKLDDMPLLIDDLWQSTRAHFLKLHSKEFVEQFEKTIYNHHNSNNQQNDA